MLIFENSPGKHGEVFNFANAPEKQKLLDIVPVIQFLLQEKLGYINIVFKNLQQ